MERLITNSQNFMHSKALVTGLVEKSNITKDDLVLEIGPGKGIITDALRERAGRVEAVEFDPHLAGRLKEQFSQADNVTVVEADFLRHTLPQKPYKVFSNIPFDLTADILAKLLAAHPIPEDMYLIMQYEAVLKYAGAPYYAESYRSLLYKPQVSVEIVHEFSPADFYPRPNVKIVLAHFHRREYCDIKNAPMAAWQDFVASVFAAGGSGFAEKTKHVFTYEQQKRLKKSLKLGETTISGWSYAQWLGLFDCYQKLVGEDKKQKVRGARERLQKTQAGLQKQHRTRGKKP